MSKEKKKTIILTVVLSLICVVLIGIFSVDTLMQKGTVVDKETKKLMNEFEEYFNSKKRTVIYYASSGCGYCQLQSPILETISDDYDMGAIRKNYSLREIVVYSINAGVNILLFSNNIYGKDENLSSKIKKIIKEEITLGNIKIQDIENSYQKIMKLKQNLNNSNNFALIKCL